MSENQQSPAGDRQDPAEQYQTDQQVDTSDQPDPVEPSSNPTVVEPEQPETVSDPNSENQPSSQPSEQKDEYVGPSQPVTVAPGAAPTRADDVRAPQYSVGEGGKLTEKSASSDDSDSSDES